MGTIFSPATVSLATIESDLSIIEGYTEKIDDAETDGLEGVHDSTAYRIAEVERHFHSYRRWGGLAASLDAEVHRLDPIGPGIAPFVIDAGNNNWGEWVCIVGSSDTPFIDPGDEYYDMDKIIVTSTERNGLHWFQYAFGTDTANAAYLAGDYTEEPFIPVSNVVDGFFDVAMKRKAVGTKIWARAFCPGQNTASVSFYPGGHEYEG